MQDINVNAEIITEQTNTRNAEQRRTRFRRGEVMGLGVWIRTLILNSEDLLQSKG